MAAADEEPAWQGCLQTPVDERMHQRSLPAMGHVAVHGTRTREGHHSAELVRACQQYPHRPPPAEPDGMTARKATTLLRHYAWRRQGRRRRRNLLAGSVAPSQPPVSLHDLSATS